MLVCAAITLVLTAQALGTPAMRESAALSLAYLPRVGFLQTGLLTHWMIDSTAVLAAVNACYAVLAGCRVQADFGKLAAAAMFLAGAVAAVAGRNITGAASDVSAIMGASGAIALWMGVSAVPYSLAAPEIAWGSVGFKSLGLRLPYVAVVVGWFLHQGLGMVLMAPEQEASGPRYAAYLAEFGLGIAVGLAARWIKSMFNTDDEQPVEPIEANSEESLQQLVQASEMVRKRPKVAAQMLRRILAEQRTNADASMALLDALHELNDRAGLAQEAVLRISVLVRRGRARQAASIYEHVRELGAEGALASRLSATIVSVLMDALVKSKAIRSAELLGQSWYASHAHDPDGWRVKQALSLLHQKLET